jgi:hypothetical protein
VLLLSSLNVTRRSAHTSHIVRKKLVRNGYARCCIRAAIGIATPVAQRFLIMSGILHNGSHRARSQVAKITGIICPASTIYAIFAMKRLFVDDTATGHTWTACLVANLNSANLKGSYVVVALMFFLLVRTDTRPP